MSKLCEWSPADNASACWSKERGHMGCPNVATVSLGVNGVWHLCASCADLPRFARYTKRTDIAKYNNVTASDLLDGLMAESLMDGL